MEIYYNVFKKIDKLSAGKKLTLCELIYVNKFRVDSTPPLGIDWLLLRLKKASTDQSDPGSCVK